MALANAISAFSIPLVRPFCSGFSTGKESFLRDDFVGDQANQVLKYLTNPELMLGTDWPLVLFGPSGTGKTALGMTMAAELANHSTGKPMVCTADEFRQRLASAIDTGSVSQFRDSVTESSVLFIDDLHRLAGYDKSQMELISILELLNRFEIPVVFTISEKCLEANSLDQRLISRLMAGLCLPVNLPGYEARKLLLSDASESLKLSLSKDELDFLASNFALTFPRMRSFLMTFHTWLESRVDDGAEYGLTDFLSSWVTANDTDTSVLDEIISQVAKAFRLKRTDVTSASRKKTVVRARGVSIFLLRDLFNFSYANIGGMFGGRDHSTVMHAISRIQEDISVDPQFKLLVDQLRQSVIEKVLIRSIATCE